MGNPTESDYKQAIEDYHLGKYLTNGEQFFNNNVHPVFEEVPLEKAYDANNQYLWSGSKMVPMAEVLRYYYMANAGTDEAKGKIVALTDVEILLKARSDSAQEPRMLMDLEDALKGGNGNEGALHKAISDYTTPNPLGETSSMAAKNTYQSFRAFKDVLENNRQEEFEILLNATAIAQTVDPHLDNTGLNPFTELSYDYTFYEDGAAGHVDRNNTSRTQAVFGGVPDRLPVTALVYTYLHVTQPDKTIDENALRECILNEPELYKVMEFAESPAFQQGLVELAGDYGKLFDVRELHTPARGVTIDPERPPTREEVLEQAGLDDTSLLNKGQKAAEKAGEMISESGQAAVDFVSVNLEQLSRVGNQKLVIRTLEDLNDFVHLSGEQRLQVVATQLEDIEAFQRRAIEQNNPRNSGIFDYFVKDWDKDGRKERNWLGWAVDATDGLITEMGNRLVGNGREERITERILQLAGENQSINFPMGKEDFILRYHDRHGTEGVLGMSHKLYAYARDNQESLEDAFQKQNQQDKLAFNTLFVAGYTLSDDEKGVKFRDDEKNLHLKALLQAVERENAEAGQKVTIPITGGSVELEVAERTLPAEDKVAYYKGQLVDQAFTAWLETRGYKVSEIKDFLENKQGSQWNRFLSEFKVLSEKGEHSGVLGYRNPNGWAWEKGNYEALLMLETPDETQKKAREAEDRGNIFTDLVESGKQAIAGIFGGQDDKKPSEVKNKKKPSTAGEGDGKSDGDKEKPRLADSPTDMGRSDTTASNVASAITAFVSESVPAMQLAGATARWVHQEAANQNEPASGLYAGALQSIKEVNQDQAAFDYAVTEMRDKAESAILQLEAITREVGDSSHYDAAMLQNARNEIERAARAIGSEAESDLPVNVQWTMLAATDAYLDRIIATQGSSPPKADDPTLDDTHEVVSTYHKAFSKVAYYESSNKLSTAAKEIVFGVHSDAPAQGYEAIATEKEQFRNDSEVLPRIGTRAKTLAKQEWEAVQGDKDRLAEHLIDEFNQEIRHTRTFQFASEDTQKTLLAMTAMVQDTKYFTDENARKTAEDALHAIFTEVKELEASRSENRRAAGSTHEALNNKVASYSSELKSGLNHGDLNNNPQRANGSHLLQAAMADVTLLEANNRGITAYVNEADKGQKRSGELNLSSF